MYRYYSRLLKKHVKLTYAREHLLNELILETSYRSADSIYLKCQDIGIATIYRNLYLYEQLEIVESINRDNIKLYKIKHPKQDNQIHFICRTCNQNYQCDDAELVKGFSILKATIDKKYHHRLDDHLLLEGVCASCLSKK